MEMERRGEKLQQSRSKIRQALLKGESPGAADGPLLKTQRNIDLEARARATTASRVSSNEQVARAKVAERKLRKARRKAERDRLFGGTVVQPRTTRSSSRVQNKSPTTRAATTATAPARRASATRKSDSQSSVGTPSPKRTRESSK